MLGLTLASETMLCLGIIFILSGLLYFYVKKQITHIEHGQMEQARLLQHVINMITNKPSLPSMMASGEGFNGTNDNAPESGNLIDVSDGEESDEEDSDDESISDNECNDDEESEEESDEEEEEEEEEEQEVEEVKMNDLKEFSIMPTQDYSMNDIDEDSIVEIPNTVKVINIDNNEHKPLSEPQEVDLDMTSLTSTNLDDDDDTLTVNSSVSGSNLAKSSLKTLKVGDLRKMVLERGVHNDPAKLKKAELITLLQQQ
jgi:hypothetical protein